MTAAIWRARAEWSARRRWFVFLVRGMTAPASPKAPLPGLIWPRAATTDATAIRRWPSRYTAYGIACKRSGLVVIDLDVAKDGSGGRGETAFKALCEDYGAEWPVTYTVATPSGGKHLYFRADPERPVGNGDSMLPPLVNVRGCRGDGGYVVGAGSVIPDGEYRVRGSVLALATLPDWLAHLLTRPSPPRLPRLPGSPSPGAGALAGWLAGQPEGNRNAGLFWAACRAAEEGGDPWALVPVAVQAGLTQREAQAAVASAARRHQGGA
jgi:hypothetical protein